MLHLHERDTWLHLSSNHGGVRVPLAGGEANKKGEMSAAHCTFELKDYILTTDSNGSHPYHQMRDEEDKIGSFLQHPPVSQHKQHSTTEHQVQIHICQQNNCSARAEMSQSWAVRKRKLLHIWRKSGNDSVCKWMRWWNTTGPLWTQRPCKHFHTKWTLLCTKTRTYRYIGGVDRRCNVKTSWKSHIKDVC